MRKQILCWTDRLELGVYKRLCDCRSRRKDIAQLVEAKWADYKSKGFDRQGLTKEDALVSILELLECNNQFFDLTKDEYNELIR